MGVLDRIILTLYTIALAIIAFLMVLFAIMPPWVPVHQWLENVLHPGGRLTVGIVGAAFLIVSGRLFLMASIRRRGGQAITHETELGEVRISLDAVENLVRKVARGIKGVREVRARVDQGSQGLAAEVRGTIAPDVSIPEVSEEIQSAVKSYVRRVVGVEVAEVRIHVDNIAGEARRRVD